MKLSNKRGGIFLGVTLGIFIYILGVLFIPFLADDIDTFRTNMDCSNSSISDGSKLTCLQGDILIPYFIWFFVSIALGFIVGGKT